MVIDAAQRVQRVTWDEFRSQLKPRQGEHITLLGPTGGGKTTLAVELLPFRRFVLVFACKRRDATMKRLQRQGWHIARTWPVSPVHERVILWPRIEKMKDVVDQQRIFAEALDEAYRRGGWTIYLDEIRYITDYLHLTPHVELLLQQGRSIDLTVIGGTQRPAHIPLTFYDQATHLFCWRDSDKRNIRRLSELGAFDSDTIASEVPSLRQHEVLYLNTRTGNMMRTKVSL